MARPAAPMSARRLTDGNGDIVRFEGSNNINNRPNRWPSLTQAQVSNGRLNTAEEKVRRSQVFIYSSKF